VNLARRHGRFGGKSGHSIAVVTRAAVGGRKPKFQLMGLTIAMTYRNLAARYAHKSAATERDRS
jgi:hypothetical protein